MASLLALSRVEQQYSKKLMSRRLWAHAATLTLGIVSLFLDDPWVYIPTVGALVTEAVAWYLKYLAEETHGRTEQAQRLQLLGQALGQQPDPSAVAELNASFSTAARSDAPNHEDANYYAAGTPIGPERLRKSIQESAFSSGQLYGFAARRSVLRLVLILAFIALAVFLLAVVAAGEVGAFAARAAAVALAALSAVDELGLALGWSGAAATSKRVVDRLDHVNVTDLGQMLAVFADYSVATHSAAPIPNKLYKKNQTTIDAAWAAR